MKRFLFSALLLMPMAAFAQPPADDARYMQQAAQQTTAELTNAIISLRATVAKLQDENAKLRADAAKTPPAAAIDPPK